MPNLSQLRKAALAAAAGLGVYGSFETDAEAVTPMQFWKAVQRTGYDTLERSRQAAIARAIRNLPKGSLDKIETVTSDPKLGVRGINTTTRADNTNWSWQQAFSQPIKTEIEKSEIYLNPKQVYETTPVHEGLHTVWYDMEPEHKIPFSRTWDSLSSTGRLGNAEEGFRSSLQDPSELFAEYGAHRLQKTPGYEGFKSSYPFTSSRFDEVLKKYTKYGLPDA